MIFLFDLDSRSDIGITLSSSGARTLYGDPTSHSMHHADISADFIDASRRSLHQNISSGSYKVNRSQGLENAVDDIQIDRRSAAPGTMFARLELSPTVDKSSRQTEYIARWPDSERTSGTATAEPNLVRHDIGLPEYTAMSSSLHDLSLTDADKLQRYELAAASRIDRPDNSARSDLHLHSTGFQSSRPYQRNYHSTPTQVPISNQDRFIQSHSNYIDSLDLTGWIQQHQQQLIQQQMITSQVIVSQGFFYINMLTPCFDINTAVRYRGRNRKTWRECLKDDMKVHSLQPEWAAFRDM